MFSQAHDSLLHIEEDDCSPHDTLLRIEEMKKIQARKKKELLEQKKRERAEAYQRALDEKKRAEEAEARQKLAEEEMQRKLEELQREANERRRKEEDEAVEAWLQAEKEWAENSSSRLAYVACRMTIEEYYRIIAEIRERIACYEEENQLPRSKIQFHSPMGRDGKTFPNHFYILSDRASLIPHLLFEPGEQPSLPLFVGEFEEFRSKFHLISECAEIETSKLRVHVLDDKHAKLVNHDQLTEYLRPLCLKYQICGWKVGFPKGKGKSRGHILKLHSNRDATILLHMSKYFTAEGIDFRLSAEE